MAAYKEYGDFIKDYFLPITNRYERYKLGNL